LHIKHAIDDAEKAGLVKSGRKGNKRAIVFWFALDVVIVKYE
jgi:hypothetical protein